jgi:hypothetical protein
VQQKNEDYTNCFQLNETTGTGAHGNNVFIHSQLLVTDQIRDAITAEAVSAAFAEPTDYVDFRQKLTLKNGRIGYVSERLLRTLKLLWNLLERSAHQASIIQTAKTCYK